MGILGFSGLGFRASDYAVVTLLSLILYPTCERQVGASRMGILGRFFFHSIFYIEFRVWGLGLRV